MPTGAITEYVDVAQLTLYAFWIFFFGLIVWIRREDRREGYPAERDLDGKARKRNFVLDPAPKEYKLAHGGGSIFLPNNSRDPFEVKAKRMSPWPGAALVPTGDPMVDGLGAAAYAQRAKTPELDLHGNNLVVPLRALPEFGVAKLSRDPRGFEVRGLDGKPVGKITDLWIDRAEQEVRHLELDGGTILPIPFAKIDLARPIVTVAAITAAQFSAVPKLSSKDTITKDEEERIQAYYGGGYLYATPKRAEPIV